MRGLLGRVSLRLNNDMPQSLMINVILRRLGKHPISANSLGPFLLRLPSFCDVLFFVLLLFGFLCAPRFSVVLGAVVLRLMAFLLWWRVSAFWGLGSACALWDVLVGPCPGSLPRFMVAPCVLVEWVGFLAFMVTHAGHGLCPFDTWACGALNRIVFGF